MESSAFCTNVITGLGGLTPIQARGRGSVDKVTGNEAIFIRVEAMISEYGYLYCILGHLEIYMSSYSQLDQIVIV